MFSFKSANHWILKPIKDVAEKILFPATNFPVYHQEESKNEAFQMKTEELDVLLMGILINTWNSRDKIS